MRPGKRKSKETSLPHLVDYLFIRTDHPSYQLPSITMIWPTSAIIHPWSIKFPAIIVKNKHKRRLRRRLVGVIVVVYFNKIISLPAPLLYCVFDRFVLLHEIPDICRFYPYFSMLFRFSICQLFCSPIGMTAEPEYYRHAAKAKERMDGKSLWSS